MVGVEGVQHLGRRGPPNHRRCYFIDCSSDGPKFYGELILGLLYQNWGT